MSLIGTKLKRMTLDAQIIFFKLLNEYIDNTQGDVQIVLFEHAPVSMFSPYDNIHVVEEWREAKLLPQHWYEGGAQKKN